MSHPDESERKGLGGGPSFEPLLFSRRWSMEKQGERTEGRTDSRTDVRSRRKPFSRTYREFAEHTSLHGIWRASNPEFHLVRRLLWVCVLLLGTVSLVFLIITQLLDFLTFRVATVVTVDDRAALSFPAVTVCNYNQFRKSLVPSDQKESEILRELFSVQDYAREIGVSSGLKVGSMRAEDYNITQTLISLAHRLEDMLIDCIWAGHRVTCMDYFSLTLTEVGVCYTFNSLFVQEKQRNLLVHNPGTDSGLLLRINIQDDEYYYGEGDAAGVQVMVHHPVEVPLVRQHGFSVGPGSNTLAAVILSQDVLARSPYGVCISHNDTSFVNPLLFHEPYTQAGCKIEHRTRFVQDICGCRMFYEPGNTTVCKTVDSVRCARMAKSNYTRTAGKEVRRECPPTCTAERYDVSLSYAAFPASHVIRELQHAFNLTEEGIRKNFLQLKIFFEDLGIHKVEQIPAYSISSFLADIGGEMGLCLGASVLTLVEVIEFLVLLVWRALRW